MAAKVNYAQPVPSIGCQPGASVDHFRSPEKVLTSGLAAGAVEVIPLALQFWGEYYGRLKDPFGHEWTIAQFVAPLTDALVEQARGCGFGSR